MGYESIIKRYLDDELEREEPFDLLSARTADGRRLLDDPEGVKLLRDAFGDSAVLEAIERYS